MLGTLEPEKKKNRKKFLPTLVFAYNATKNESTGFSPYELMFGRKPRLPIDSVFHLENSRNTITSYYVTDLKERIEISHDIANKALKKARDKQKLHFDKRARATELHVGETVLVKILSYERKHKIADKFEKDPYIVINQPNIDIPVFIVRSEDGTEKTLHRNHLLPIEVSDNVKNSLQNTNSSVSETTNDVSFTNKEKDIQSSRPIPKPRKKTDVVEILKPIVVPTKDITMELDREDESENDYVYAYSYEVDRPAGHDTEDIVDHVSINIESTEPENIVEEVHVPETLSAEADVIDEANNIDVDLLNIGTTDDRTPVPRPRTRVVEPPAEPPPPRPPPRMSSRERRKPEWHKDYVVGQQTTDYSSPNSDMNHEQWKQLLQEQASLTAKLLNVFK